LLESGATDGELRDLDEKELEAVFGGAKLVFLSPPDLPTVIPMYGLPPYKLEDYFI
jgi:hypothetical protein